MGGQMDGWDNFAIAQVGASAALAGLTFLDCLDARDRNP
jgi:hypothetical protein